MMNEFVFAWDEFHVDKYKNLGELILFNLINKKVFFQMLSKQTKNLLVDIFKTATHLKPFTNKVFFNSHFHNLNQIPSLTSFPKFGFSTSNQDDSKNTNSDKSEEPKSDSTEENKPQKKKRNRSSSKKLTV